MAKSKSTTQVAGNPIYAMLILFPSNFSTKLGASTSMAYFQCLAKERNVSVKILPNWDTPALAGRFSNV
jgi:hypothetical protein